MRGKPISPAERVAMMEARKWKATWASLSSIATSLYGPGMDACDFKAMYKIEDDAC